MNKIMTASQTPARPTTGIDKIKSAFLACLLATALTPSASRAQGPENFDPAQFRQQMIERFRETFEIKDAAEWTAVSAKITAVMDAQRDLMSQSGRGPGGPGFGPPGGGGPGPAGPGGTGGPVPDNSGAGTGGQGGPGGPGPQSSVEAQALEKALQAKAAPVEIKIKLAKLRDATKARQAKLEQAREDLRALLTSRQEALAVLMGLLN